ncbi:MAG: ABC transporter substrate-binding protein [Syntrophaceae bacterium]|nr:ABC transporter substrate-binding protein [Syntrophaceae bacterium]
MKKSIVLLAFLVSGLSFLFAGPKAEETTATKGPQYGGTLTVFGGSQNEDPASPDIVDGFWPPRFLMFIEEHLLEGDFVKYGPRGTNEYPFTSISYIPDQFLKGNLIESWDITPAKTVWHVRPGIKWHDVPHVMGNRDLELTAQDLVDDLIYFSKSPNGSANFAPMFTKIYALDKYTVVIETPDFNVDLMYVVGYEDRATYTPPEVYKAPGGGSKWENRVGTGPYIFEEYVVGSHMSYKKNPNWWRGTTTIDGVEYKVPFIDRMVKPIIPDVSTRVAAIRTATLDFYYDVDPSAWQTLDEQKGLLSKKFLGGNGIRWALNVKDPPLNDIAVRKALFRGTDIDAFGKAQYAGIDVDLPIHWFPMYPYDPSVYTPMDQLPPEISELYDYDPVAAKKMLADAGYPNGFKLEVNAESTALGQARASLLEDQWSKIGVKLEIKSYSTADQMRMGFQKDYKNVCFDAIETANAILTLRQAAETGHALNITTSQDAYVDEEMATIMAEIDPDKRSAMMKELGVYVLGQVYNIPANSVVNADYWWPWIKNYYGEASIGDVGDWEVVLGYAWIDEALKKEMGY